jgi:rare lipoprotein A (peptidoglycan hydrolase)
MSGKRTRARSVAGAMMAAAALLLAGCSTVTPPAGSRKSSATSPANYVQPLPAPSASGPRKKSSGTVTASRYSTGLAGNCTSNGERYNPNSLTAASKSLPMGSTVKVTNVKNGNSVSVRINDRGPYVRGRSLDISSRAAHDIGLGNQGLAKVKLTQQQPSPSAATPSANCD